MRIPRRDFPDRVCKSELLRHPVVILLLQDRGRAESNIFNPGFVMGLDRSLGGYEILNDICGN